MHAYLQSDQGETRMNRMEILRSPLQIWLQKNQQRQKWQMELKRLPISSSQHFTRETSSGTGKVW